MLWAAKLQKADKGSAYTRVTQNFYNVEDRQKQNTLKKLKQPQLLIFI